MRLVSLRTWMVAALSVVGVVAVWLLVNTSILAEDARLIASDVGSALMITLAGLVVLATALSFQRGEAMRRYWWPIAAGVLCTGAGDWVWAYFELVRGVEPYPSLADAFYVAQYPFFAFGLISAALAYRGFVEITLPLTVTSALAVLGSFAVTFGLLLPYIVSDPAETLVVKVLSSFYPLADILLAASPAVFIALVLSKLGAGRLAWPWRAVALGLILLAAADTLFSWQDWAGAYTAGGLIDIMWILAFSTIAVGASLGRDIAKPVVSIKGEPSRAAA